MSHSDCRDGAGGPLGGRVSPVAQFSTGFPRLSSHSGGMEQRWRLVIVQRTHRTVLNAILQNPDRWPARSAVMLDRRLRERRVKIQQVTLERRRGQRRIEPGAMWHTHGFIVVETTTPPDEAVPLA